MPPGLCYWVSLSLVLTSKLCAQICVLLIHAHTLIHPHMFTFLLVYLLVHFLTNQMFVSLSSRLQTNINQWGQSSPILTIFPAHLNRQWAVLCQQRNVQTCVRLRQQPIYVHMDTTTNFIDIIK